MKTDIEIAQEAVMEPITNVAAGIGIDADDLELYGKYKAKLSEEFLEKIQARPNGKLILVTAINPTPAGAVSYTHLSPSQTGMVSIFLL